MRTLKLGVIWKVVNILISSRCSLSVYVIHYSFNPFTNHRLALAATESEINRGT